jgi:hypothetical protein
MSRATLDERVATLERQVGALLAIHAGTGRAKATHARSLYRRRSVCLPSLRRRGRPQAVARASGPRTSAGRAPDLENVFAPRSLRPLDFCRARPTEWACCVLSTIALPFP